MQVQTKYVLYSNEQIRDMSIVIVADHQSDESYIAHNKETGQMVMVLRNSTATEDEIYLRQQMELLRFDWLGILGYEMHQTPGQ